MPPLVRASRKSLSRERDCGRFRSVSWISSAEAGASATFLFFRAVAIAIWRAIVAARTTAAGDTESVSPAAKVRR